jgi:hypothetical protein
MEFTELMGTYEANYDAGLIDRIEIRSDSTYIRSFVTNDGRQYVDTGRYKFEFVNGDPRKARIRFLSFVNRFPVDPESRAAYSDASDAVLDTVPRYWATAFYKSGGKNPQISIGRSAYGQAYIKQE